MRQVSSRKNGIAVIIENPVVVRILGILVMGSIAQVIGECYCRSILEDVGKKTCLVQILLVEEIRDCSGCGLVVFGAVSD